MVNMSLTMSEKIKMLRTQKGYTLEQVAQIVGVGKSTVRKWEVGIIENMRRDKIALLAQALGTTPAYLMGWVEEESPRDTTITEGAKAILEAYRSLPEAARDKLTQLLVRFRALDPSEQEHYLDVLRVMLRRTP
jgi:transcriptional regulator with XRE-family HTH domain